MVVLCSAVAAGDKNNPRATGMAGTINGPARGLAALGVNPANLGLGGHQLISVSLLSMGFRVSSELASYDIYNEYFTGTEGTNGVREPRFLNEADKARLLSGFPDGTAVSRMDLEVMPAGLAVYHPAVGGFAIAIKERVGIRTVVPKDFLTMLLYGLDPEGSSFSFDRTRISAWWFRELNLSYGRQVPVSLPAGGELFAGMGVKFLAGYGVMETLRYAATIANEPTNGNQYRGRLSFDYQIRRAGVEVLDPDKGGGVDLFPAPAGTGFGMDFGLAGRVYGVDVHLSITDIGSIRWKRNTVETYSQYQTDITDPFLGTIEDSLQYAVRGRNRSAGEFKTSLPTKLRIGVVVESNSQLLPPWFPSDLLIAFDFTQGLNGSMGNPDNPRVSIGVEYSGIDVLSMQTGLSVGDDTKLRWAAGIGLELTKMSIGIATENIPLLFSSRDFDLYSLSAGFQFRF